MEPIISACQRSLIFNTKAPSLTNMDQNNTPTIKCLVHVPCTVIIPLRKKHVVLPHGVKNAVDSCSDHERNAV